MKSNSPIVKRSLVIGGHKTSVSIEDDFWLGLKHIAGERKLPVAKLVQEIDGDRERGNLSSAIRVFVLRYYRKDGGGTENRALRKDFQ